MHKEHSIISLVAVLSATADTILEEDHPMTIPSKFGFN
jgi:hypothetical protein